MCKEKKKAAQSSLIFMNTPIADISEDVVGFSTHVEKLHAAIASGGQMIALTSPFGAGKTSIVELLQKEYEDDSQKRIIKVSMWSHLPSDKGEATEGHTEGDTAELHKGFVYQLITQINRQKGKYISRLLNPSFGLLKLQINRVRYWLYTIAALILFVFGYIMPEKFDFSLPFLGEKAASWEWIMVFASVILLALIITRAEIVFSSNKSEGGRTIDTNEIMQLYRTEVLEYKIKCCRKSCHYIVVIEDLDRTEDNKAVINFLKELRRYYVPENMLSKSNAYKNRVTFLINVKPETLLRSEEREENERERLYAKLFDFVLNLQTINIDDYNTILEELLQKKSAELNALGFEWGGRMIDIPGMRWITRGKRIGIREIKDRLNTAFSLYESLKEKFGGIIEFEKCAIAAYVTAEFEKDFYATDDLAFQKLVNAYLKKELNDAKMNEVLPNAGSDYKKAVQDLIESKQIDSNYRIYFYNYPKSSRVLSADEAIVQQAILYDEAPETLEQSIKKVVQDGSPIIRDAVENRNNLGLMLPDIVFRHEALYMQSLKYAFPKVVTWVQKLDYSADGSEKTIEQLRTILHFDHDRTVYSPEYAKEFVKVWEEKFSETALLQFRKLLCNDFSQEISLYLPLFFGVHKIVSVEELRLLSVIDTIDVINEDNEGFSVDLVDYVVNRFLKEGNVDHMAGDMEKFLKTAQEKLGKEKMPIYLLAFQEKVEKIVPDFETVIADALLEENGAQADETGLLQGYQRLINLAAETELSVQTMKNVSLLEKYGGYSLKVTEQMGKSGYMVDFVLQTLSCGCKVPFEREDVAVALHAKIHWLLDRPQAFFTIREAIIKEKDIEIIHLYQFMFDENSPIMTKDEFHVLQFSAISDQDIIALLPPSLVTENEIDMLVSYFGRHRQGTTESFEILMFISQLHPVVAKKMFYALNFDMIRYRYMSADRKNRVKKAFSETLSLNETEERIHFMVATRILDSLWESQMRNELKDDENLQKAYVAAVEHDDSTTGITKNTVQILCSFSTVPLVSKRVYQRYFDYGYYKQYVSCITRDRETFEMEEGERGALLWPVYVEMFRQNGYKATKEYMYQNTAFLKKCMQEKVYVGMQQKSFLALATIRQSKECIEYCLSLDAESALEYLTKIDGFADRDAAESFVEGVEKRVDLLQSDELYAHTHDKLLDGLLKSKYTRARTRNGF